MCPSVLELSAFHDHELDPVRAAAVAEHVASCAECQKTLREMDRLTELFARAAAPEPSAEAQKRLHRFVNQLPIMWLWKLAPAFSAVAAALLIFAGPPALKVMQATPTRTAQVERASWETTALAGSSDELSTDRSSESAVARWMTSELASPAASSSSNRGSTP
jgi:anti-sigma factor RsiW